MSQMPPERPWIKGRNPAYTAFSLVVEICIDTFGRVWSRHDFESPVDSEIALQTSGGGARQIAFALLSEAIRREAFAGALIRLTEDPSYLAKYKVASAEGRLQAEEALAKATQKIIVDALGRFTKSAVQEILCMLSNNA